MKTKHKFPHLGFTAYTSEATKWVTIQGEDISQGWDVKDEECPAFIRRALEIPK